MDRTVESILADWRHVERELEAAMDQDTQEDLEARTATLAQEYAGAVGNRMAKDGRSSEHGRSSGHDQSQG